MRSFIAALLIALLPSLPLAAQESTQPPAPIISAPQSAPSLVVPQGTIVPLSLVTPIHSLSTKPGDTVRAMVVFPIIVGSQIAIPAGTFVEGIANTIVRLDKKTHQPSVQIHFTRLIYANGYMATLDAANTAEVYVPPANLTPAMVLSAYNVWSGRSSAPQYKEATYPQPPPFDGSDHPLHIILPSIFGFLAAITLLVIAIHHHSASVANHTDFLLYDTGWQFQLSLTSPLTLDTDKVNAAASTSVPAGVI